MKMFDEEGYELAAHRVLKLENGPIEGRIDANDILLGNDVDLMDLVNQK